jgi:hypothetical protein
MKAKKIVSKESEQPKPLLAPLDESLKARLLRFEKIAIALGETLVEAEETSPVDIISSRLDRASALCGIVQEMGLGHSPNQIPGTELATVMDIVREDLEIAQWVVRRTV